MSVEETPMSKNMHDASDEAYETLSLSDLPLYSSVDEWEEQSSAGSSAVSTCNEHDYFEFSSELSPPAATAPPENVVFCGKLIHYRKPDASQKVENSKQTRVEKRHGRGVLRWILQSKNGTKCTTTAMQKKDDRQSSERKYKNGNHGGGYFGFPLHKMPILTSMSSCKAGWYLFLSGISRSSGEMGLRDLKTRQSRRHSPPPSPTTLKFLNRGDEKVGRGTKRVLSGLIGLLSCGGNHHPDDAMVATD